VGGGGGQSMLVVVNTALIFCHCELNMWFMTGADDSVTVVIMWHLEGFSLFVLLSGQVAQPFW
jgi:hypothetical protein